MNKQELLNRIDALKQSQEQLKQQFATISGHLGEAEFWLDELNKLEDSLKKPVELPSGEENECA